MSLRPRPASASVNAPKSRLEEVLWAGLAKLSLESEDVGSKNRPSEQKQADDRWAEGRARLQGGGIIKLKAQKLQQWRARQSALTRQQKLAAKQEYARRHAARLDLKSEADIRDYAQELLDEEEAEQMEIEEQQRPPAPAPPRALPAAAGKAPMGQRPQAKPIRIQIAPDELTDMALNPIEQSRADAALTKWNEQRRDNPTVTRAAYALSQLQDDEVASMRAAALKTEDEFAAWLCKTIDPAEFEVRINPEFRVADMLIRRRADRDDPNAWYKVQLKSANYVSPTGYTRKRVRVSGTDKYSGNNTMLMIVGMRRKYGDPADLDKWKVWMFSSAHAVEKNLLIYTEDKVNGSPYEQRSLLFGMDKYKTGLQSVVPLVQDNFRLDMPVSERDAKLQGFMTTKLRRHLQPGGEFKDTGEKPTSIAADFLNMTSKTQRAEAALMMAMNGVQLPGGGVVQVAFPTGSADKVDCGIRLPEAGTDGGLRAMLTELVPLPDNAIGISTPCDYDVEAISRAGEKRYYNAQVKTLRRDYTASLKCRYEGQEATYDTDDRLALCLEGRILHDARTDRYFVAYAMQNASQLVLDGLITQHGVRKAGGSTIQLARGEPPVPWLPPAIPGRSERPDKVLRYTQISPSQVLTPEVLSESWVWRPSSDVVSEPLDDYEPGVVRLTAELLMSLEEDEELIQAEDDGRSVSSMPSQKQLERVVRIRNNRKPDAALPEAEAFIEQALQQSKNLELDKMAKERGETVTAATWKDIARAVAAREGVSYEDYLLKQKPFPGKKTNGLRQALYKALAGRQKLNTRHQERDKFFATRDALAQKLGRPVEPPNYPPDLKGELPRLKYLTDKLKDEIRRYRNELDGTAIPASSAGAGSSSEPMEVS
jgi:hypothetical protein